MMLTSAAMQMTQLLMHALVLLKVVREKLEKSSQLAIKWFSHNHMELNAEKCEFLMTGHRFEHLWLNVGEIHVCGKKSGQVSWHNN